MSQTYDKRNLNIKSLFKAIYPCNFTWTNQIENIDKLLINATKEMEGQYGRPPETNLDVDLSAMFFDVIEEDK